MNLKEGIVLNYNTCESIDPVYLVEYGKHTEKVLVVEVKGDYIKLYNLTSGRVEKVEKKLMEIYIRHKLYEVTNEVA